VGAHCIGVKTIGALALGAVALAVGARRHALDPAYLGHLSPAACFLVALVASLAVALIGVGWRFGARSKLGIGLVRGRPALIEYPAAQRTHDLPGVVQRLVLTAGFAGVVLAALGNHAAARIVQLPDELGAPAPSEYCMPEPVEPAAPAPAAAPAPPVEQPGCALVMRAFKLGYAKSLGSCAPKQAAPVAVETKKPKREVCTRRQLDEPYLHYGFRRVAGAAGATSSVDPIAAADHRVSDVRTHLDFLDGLLADIRHAITGTPHASHHLWVNLPDPHPQSIGERFTGSERCSQRFADLPLWPAWQPGDEARLVEHVLGQLLFATRFGSTASCSDYVIHWDAAPDTCRQLAADPVATLDRDGALAAIRAVLDRRRRQLEIGELATALGRQPPVTPPGAAAIVSVACFVVDRATPGAPTGAARDDATAHDATGARDATGGTIALDGDAISWREIHVAGVRTGGDGPIDVYAGLARLLGGPGGDLAAAIRAPEPVELSGDDFLLARLDPLIDADPFRGARDPLGHPEIVEVYPFEHHLHGFIDGFRRRYLAQRGRL
jgi:hypothetical protein